MFSLSYLTNEKDLSNVFLEIDNLYNIDRLFFQSS